jgi:hypothetical protein
VDEPASTFEKSQQKYASDLSPGREVADGVWNKKPDKLAPMGRVFVISALAVFVLLVWAGGLYEWIEAFEALMKKRCRRKRP